jgi:DNA-binding NarL/FixJ family response regulator
MIRTLLADGNDTFRLGVRTALEKQPSGATIDEARDRAQLMMSLRSRDYGLIIIDPLLTGGTGEGLIRQVCALAPKSNILVFTAMDELVYGSRVIRSGARGYLPKTCSAEDLTTAVARVGSGKMHISRVLSEEIANNLYEGVVRPLHDQLTERELQVFSMLVCGTKVTEVAKNLHLSVKTISTHKIRIMGKLRVTSLSEMIQYAIAQRLLESCKTRCASFCKN